jgi:prolyl-tRNA editing enzyme YbaK/EbsC (Cys-tRNA(Pro) deacylase)
MWPPEVERVVAPLRAAALEARVEELPLADDALPPSSARAVAFDCAGRVVVALVPPEQEADPDKIAAAGGLRPIGPAAAPPFPYAEAARVLFEQRLLAHETVWVEAGSPRYVLGLEPDLLVQLTRAVPADLTRNG